MLLLLVPLVPLLPAEAEAVRWMAEFAAKIALVPLNLIVAGIYLKSPGFARPIVLLLALVWLLTTAYEVNFFVHYGSFGGVLVVEFVTDAFFLVFNFRILMDKRK